MYEAEHFEFPDVLDPTKHYYPVNLFDDRVIKQENGEEKTIPISVEEEHLILAQFAVLKSLRLNANEETLIKVARDEGSREGFMPDIRKMQYSTHKGYEGMTKGDIELIADGLGVYEIIWPFDPCKWQEAAEAELRTEVELVEA